MNTVFRDVVLRHRPKSLMAPDGAGNGVPNSHYYSLDPVWHPLDAEAIVPAISEVLTDADQPESQQPFAARWVVCSHVTPLAVDQVVDFPAII